MRKVRISRGPDGWRYVGDLVRSQIVFASYGDAISAARRSGYQIDNAGWRHSMMVWNWNDHAIDGFPGWELDGSYPAFWRITHTRGKGMESSQLVHAWDDVASVDFYQRDWTEDGTPSVANGDTYWSGWWFATLAERDRFVTWLRKRAAR